MGKLEIYGLPADLDCETFVLGAVLQDYAKYLPQVADIVAEEDFSIEKHRTLWRRMMELRAAGEPIDRVTTFKALAKHGETELVGGLSYLTTLDDLLPAIPNVGAYASRVKEKSTLRQAITACQATIERLSDPRATPDDVIAAESVIRRIAGQSSKRRRLVSIAEVIKGGEEAEKRAAFLQPANLEGGVPLPWPGVQNLFSGLTPGKMTILAARPSVGKTTAAVQMALHAASGGTGVVFVSLEMPALDLVRKLVAARANVSLNEWVLGRASTEDRRAIMAATKQAMSLPFWLDDQPRATVEGVHAAILRHKADHPVGLVICDYLGLFTPTGRGDNRNNDVSEMTRNLKLASMELGVPFLVLSQLSRANEQQGRKPRLSDLRDSGSIEQDADNVIFLHRAEKPFVDLIVAKQRLGPIGEVRLVFDRRSGVFTEVQAE